MRSVSRSSGVARCQTSRQRQIGVEELLLAIPLSQPQRHRAHVLPPEGLPTRRDSLRPQCRELPRRSLHRGRRQLLVMSLDPSTYTGLRLYGRAPVATWSGVPSRPFIYASAFPRRFPALNNNIVSNSLGSRFIADFKAARLASYRRGIEPSNCWMAGPLSPVLLRPPGKLVRWWI